MIASERPVVLTVDDQGRLHGETAAALAYSDGYSLYAWHGVLVPRKAIEEPDKLTAAEINAEPNVESRRVMLDRFGWDRYLLDSDAQLVNEDDYGKLWRAQIADDEDLVMVEKVCPSTGRKYLERVPPTVRTARAAVAWQAAMPEQDYVLAAES